MACNWANIRPGFVHIYRFIGLYFCEFGFPLCSKGLAWAARGKDIWDGLDTGFMACHGASIGSVSCRFPKLYLSSFYFRHQADTDVMLNHCISVGLMSPMSSRCTFRFCRFPGFWGWVRFLKVAKLYGINSHSLLFTLCRGRDCFY